MSFVLVGQREDDVGFDSVRRVESHALSDFQAFARSTSRWDARFAALHALLIKESRLPSRRSADPAERLLHSWLRQQRALYLLGKLDGTRMKILAAVHPLVAKCMSGWLCRADRWKAKLVGLTDFVKSTGRLPEMSAPTLKERSLRIWLDAQATKYYAGQLANDRVHAMKASHDVLAERVAIWADGDRLWRKRAAQLMEFIVQTKRFPEGAAAAPVKPKLMRG